MSDLQVQLVITWFVFYWYARILGALALSDGEPTLAKYLGYFLRSWAVIGFWGGLYLVWF